MHTPKLLRATPGLRTGDVRIGSTHSYSFNGDQVRLDAELLIDTSAEPSERDWALQLWACAAPFDGHPTAGTLVAQIPFDPIGSDALQYVSAEAPAFPPAGHGSHAMVLALAAGHDGRFDELHDYANYPRTESFAQPEFNGAAGFDLRDEVVTLNADGITNPRTDNLSGTLSLELWALANPYTSGAPEGVQLAVSQLGCLAGQQAWHDIRVDVPLAAKPAGTWNVALLLREWTPAGFLTRDYVNFALPVSWPDAEAAVEPVAEEAAAAPEPAVEEPVVAEEPAAIEEQAPKKGKKKSAKAKGDKKAKTNAPVSINKASESELAAVKGLPKAVAAAIVAARPLASLDELLKVKGMGAKLLDKLKAELSL